SQAIKFLLCVFFFQAEDGIRDRNVTGVQTCALPILKSAVANAQQAAQRQNTPFDADTLRVSYAVVNEGQTLKRFTAAAMGRGTPILKRTSHVEIRVAGVEAPVAPATAAKPAAVKAEAKAEKKPRAKAKKKAAAKKEKSTKKASR